MTSSMGEAFRWWNGVVSTLPPQNRPPKCTVPQATTCVFTKILPILAKNVIPKNSDQEYWNSLRVFVATFLCTDNVPDPLTEFSDFLAFLYDHRKILRPESSSDCLQFFTHMTLMFSPHSLVYDAPYLCGDPNIYLQSILYLKDTSHPFWTQILTGTYEIDTLFNMYQSFHVPSGNTSGKGSWEFRLKVAEIVYELTLASLCGNPNAEEYLQTFNTNTIAIIKEAPQDVALCMSRLYIGMMKRLMFTVQETELEEFAFQLLNAVVKKEIAYNYVIRFFLTIRPKILRGFKMIKVVSMVGVNSTHDIENLCDLATVAGPAPVIVCLGWNMFQSKVWHRSCFSAILQLANQYDSDTDLREWLIHFIKMLFMFVSLTVLRGKYEQRAVLICESLARLMHGGLPWVRRTVMVSAASAWASGSTPPYFEQFFTIVRETDPKYAEEYNMLLMMDIDMKFFPFDGNTLKLVNILPQKQKVTKLVKIPKTSTRAKTLKGGKKAKKGKEKGGTKSGKTLTNGVAAPKKFSGPKTIA